MTNYHNKATRKKLRQLADLAHEREVSTELHKLHDQFEQWQAGKIVAFTLNEQIHQFHQQTSWEIWKLYNFSKDHTLQVARALKFAFLAEEDRQRAARVARIIARFFRGRIKPVAGTPPSYSRIAWIVDRVRRPFRRDPMIRKGTFIFWRRAAKKACVAFFPAAGGAGEWLGVLNGNYLFQN